MGLQSVNVCARTVEAAARRAAVETRGNIAKIIRIFKSKRYRNARRDLES